MKNLILISILSLVLCTACNNPEDSTSGIIPEPANIEYNRGKLIINNNSKIYISEEELRPLANILQSSIQSISGLSPEITSTRTGKNNIELILKDNYDPEEYELKISENASLYASGYNSAAFGLSSLVQLIREENKEISLPRLSIKDKPAYNYRAVLIDLARFWHPVESVEETIDLLWFYKIRYLHLHLSDNRRMTFPLDDYPELKTINADGGREYYTREELDKLVEYARQRGVIIIPEIEFPGHSGQLYQKYPETFGSVDPATGQARPLYAVNIAKEETYEACGEIIKSLAEVFYTSPYIHIGGDEVYLENIKRLPEYKSFCLEKNLIEAADGNAQELFCHFINRMHEVVRECGKETIIWEGFPGSGAGSEQISKDIKVIVWNTTYNHPDTLIAGGFKIINSTWMPWYMVGAMNFAPSIERALDWEVSSWRHWRTDIPDINIEKNNSTLGGQICFWEQNHFRIIPILRDRVPVLAEKLWSRDTGLSKEDFIRRLKKSDNLFSTLFKPLTFSARNLAVESDMTFTDTAWISINNITGIAGIQYTVSDSWDLPDKDKLKSYSGEFPLTDDCIITAWPVNKDGIICGSYTQAYYHKILPVYNYRVFAPAPVKGWDGMPDFETLNVVREGISGRMTPERLQKINGELFAKVNPEGHIETRFEGQYNQYAVELKGRLISPGGKLSFKVLSHDGLADFYLDGEKVFTGTEFEKKYEEFEIDLPEGEHIFTINYYYRSIQNQLSILYKEEEMDEYEAFENLVMELDK